MNSKSNERSSSGASAIAVVLLIGLVMLPVGYVLSLGPAVWMHDRGWLPDSVGIVYWPLIVLCTYSSTFEEMLNRYVELWQ